jgi:hypothetical protein
MESLLTDSLSVSEDKIINILSDLHLMADTDYLQCTPKQANRSLKKLK